MKNSTLIAVITGVILLLGGGAFLMRHQIKEMIMGNPSQPPAVNETVNTTQPTTSDGIQPSDATSSGYESMMVPASATVTFDGSVFTPETVTVKKGQAVKFVNKGTTTMWIASAIHPTHLVYPEFDQKKTADEYTFTFTKVGSWSYHNHTPFVSGGTVVVIE